ncbi:MAG: phospholipase D family protein, partial [Rhizobiales bacterium]|nr:phospholipase D family protein [Rhizobacter sp.]
MNRCSHELREPRRAVTAVIARVMALAALLLSGCASLPGDVERVASAALPASVQTTIGRVAAASAPLPPASGFRLMHSGPLALDARLELIERAERSLDVQYYHIQNDATGRRFMRGLRDAAVRGVRVRLLIDDLYTAGEDELLLGLLAHGNAEVRLFNPFAARGIGLISRFAASLHEFDRVQRRMHNKLFIADGALAIAGGRNIGDEYYWQSQTSVFFDLDVLLAGPVVDEMAGLFDRYWNSPHAYPAQALLRSGLAPPALRERFVVLAGDAVAPRLALPEVD